VRRTPHRLGAGLLRRDAPARRRARVRELPRRGKCVRDRRRLGGSKKARILPPEASHGSTKARARSGSRWKSPTRTAKIKSKRRSPRSRSSSSASRNFAFPSSTNAELRRAAASTIFGDRSIAVSRPPSSRSHTIAAATPWPQPISRTRSWGRMPSSSTTARSGSLILLRRRRRRRSRRRSCALGPAGDRRGDDQPGRRPRPRRLLARTRRPSPFAWP
jgi:hypothetical protein